MENPCDGLFTSPGTPCRWLTRTCSTSWAPSPPGWSSLPPVSGTTTPGAAAPRSTRVGSSRGWRTGWTSARTRQNEGYRFSMEIVRLSGRSQWIQDGLAKVTLCFGQSSPSGQIRLKYTWVYWVSAGADGGNKSIESFAYFYVIDNWLIDWLFVLPLVGRWSVGRRRQCEETWRPD